MSLVVVANFFSLSASNCLIGDAIFHYFHGKQLFLASEDVQIENVDPKGFSMFSYYHE